jgi:ABC-type multidrug transport system fused ATPase/permease subunit
LKSGADAEQALSSIKVIKAFGQEAYEAKKFEKHLEGDQKELKEVSLLYGLSQGLLDSVIQFGRSYSLLMGAIFTINEVDNWNTGERFKSGEVASAFMGLMMGW